MRKSLFTGVVMAILATTNSCKTEKNNVVSDIDGNIYGIVTIGNQKWMQQNLQTAHYSNGDHIAEVVDNTSWYTIYYTGSQTPAWCYYADSVANNAIYGKLYNWYAVIDPRGLCPVGFHVAADSDFTILSDYLGGDLVSGSFLKSTSSLWSSPNMDADNSTRFTGLPGGYRGNFGGFHNLGDYGYFWSSKPYNSNNAWFRYLGYRGGHFSHDTILKEFAFSVRCVGN